MKSSTQLGFVISLSVLVFIFLLLFHILAIIIDNKLPINEINGFRFVFSFVFVWLLLKDVQTKWTLVPNTLHYCIFPIFRSCLIKMCKQKITLMTGKFQRHLNWCRNYCLSSFMSLLFFTYIWMTIRITITLNWIEEIISVCFTSFVLQVLLHLAFMTKYKCMWLFCVKFYCWD